MKIQMDEGETTAIGSSGSPRPAPESIWVVEEGEYSDYRVVGVFTTEANAKRVGNLTGGDVDEWLLDPNIEELNQGLQIYLVLMHKDGTVDRCEQQEIDSYGLMSIGVHVWERSKAPAYQGKGVDDLLQAKVWAKSETHAIKIANEHRAEFIAAGKLR